MPKPSTLFSILGAACFIATGICITGPDGWFYTILTVLGGYLGTKCLKVALEAKVEESQPRG